MKKRIAITTGVMLFVMFALPAVAMAAGGGGGGLDAIPTTILSPLQAATESIIRLSIFIMGLLLPLGVVVGVAMAGYHHTLGRSYGVSSGIMLALSAVAAFILGLLFIRMAPMIAKSVSEKYLTSNALVLQDVTQDMGAANGSNAQVDPEHLFDNAQVKEMLTNLVTMILRIILYGAMLLLFISVALGGAKSSLGAVLANSTILSSGLGKAAVGIVLLILVIISVPLTKQMAQALLPSLLPSQVIYLPNL